MGATASPSASVGGAVVDGVDPFGTGGVVAALPLAGALALGLGLALVPASGLLGLCNAFTQLMGSPAFEHSADHSETMNKCSGRLHEAFGSNMRSWSTKFWA